MITYDELVNCEARLEHTYRDVSPPGLHPPRMITTYVDEQGWRLWREKWLTLRGQGVQHEPAIRQVENEIDVIEGRPPRWPDPFPPEPPQPVACGPLSMQSDLSYRLNGGPVLPIGVHFGEAFSLWCHGREGTVLTELDDMAEAGYHFLRTWITLPDTDYWDGRGVSPNMTTDYWPKLHDLVREVQDRGLLLHLACGDLESYSDSQRRAIFDNLANLIRSEGDKWVALIEGLNEARDTGLPDPAKVRELVRIVHEAHPHLLTALSAYTGTEEADVLAAWTADWQRLFYVHGYRGGRHYDKLRHIFSMGYEDAIRRLGWQGEPFGPGASVSCVDYPGELDAETMALAAAQSVCSRQAWCFHQDSGAIYKGRVKEQPGYYEAPALLRELPQDVMAWPSLFHGGEAWAAQRVLAAVDEVRCDHTMADDGRFVVRIYGPSGSYRLPVARSFHGWLFHPANVTASEVEADAGGQLDVSFTRGRVLVGQLR